MSYPICIKKYRALIKLCHASKFSHRSKDGSILSLTNTNNNIQYLICLHMSISSLTLCILKEFFINTDTISKGLPSVYFKGSWVEFSKL